MKPLLFVTSYAPRERIGAFAALHEREDACFALFGGRAAHGPGTPPPPPPGALPARAVGQREAGELAASGDFRAVACGTGGRVALPAAWRGARRAGVPFLLWATMWSHPRTLAHALSYAPLGHIMRDADAVVTYGPHVSEYVRRRGARRIYEAPQAVENEWWGARVQPDLGAWPEGASMRVLFVGRAAREKGLQVLHRAWRASGLAASAAALVLVGVGPAPPWVPPGGAVARGEGDSLASVRALGPLAPERLRELYGAADVLVLPSIPTRTFREPWGLVINEAMNQHTAIIATDAVGAAAGGLVRHERNGLVVPAGDAGALAGALRRLAGDPGLRERLAAAGARDVAPYRFSAWAAGFSEALADLRLSREALLA